MFLCPQPASLAIYDPHRTRSFPDSRGWFTASPPAQAVFPSAYGGHSLNLGFTKQDSRATVERNRAAFLASSRGSEREETLAASHPAPDSFRPHSLRFQTPERTARRRWPDHQHAAEFCSASRPPTACRSSWSIPNSRAVGVFHAGWRGTVRRIVEKGVGEMRGCFGTRPRDIKAAIGPGVHGCCYQVGEEVRVRLRIPVRLRR